MAKISLKIECHKCMEDFEKEIQLDARNKIEKDHFVNQAINEGWHVGLIALCPTCKKTITDTCSQCKNFENKTMCPPMCEIHNVIVNPNGDYCSKFAHK